MTIPPGGGPRELTENQLIDLLAERTAAHGEQARLAAELGVSRVMISLVLNGHRRLTDKIARRLGYLPVRRYVPVPSLARKAKAEAAARLSSPEQDKKP